MRSLTRLLAVLPRRLDADLTRSTGLSATDYYVLVHLSEAPERRLRMTDLAAGAALSAKRGDTKVSDLQGASKEMYDSMSESELEDLASTSHDNLPEKKGD